MSKYDFEIDLSSNTSTGIILNEIPKGSVVLEFGCATGRMTRYMKEALACQVYIVEYDRGAYETAMQYACDGVCDDILAFRWAEKFRDIRFDAIIFADVLEHLSTPERALEEAAKLLKDTGRLFVSVPNITHNDILLKASRERFDYTATGLLDDTHVHFWGLENLKALDGKWGLRISTIQGTYCPTGSTEQASNERNMLLENILRQRPCGEVYQFVVTMDRSETSQLQTQFRTSTVSSHIYLDLGRDFNPNDIVSFDSVHAGQGIYRSHYVLTPTEELRAIRFDPVEFQGCILHTMSVRQGERSLPVCFSGGIALEKGVLMPGDDPAVLVSVDDTDTPITVDAEFILPGEAYVRFLNQAAQTLAADCAQRQGVIEELNRVCAGQQAAINSLEGQKQLLQGTVQTLSTQRDALQKDLEQMRADNAQLQQEVCAYIVLTNNKEKYALEVERERDAYIAQTQYYQNLKIVKLRSWAARKYKGLKRRVKRLLGKGGQT